MTVAVQSQEPVVLSGGGWSARYSQDSDNEGKPTYSFDAVLFFVVQPRSRTRAAVGYVLDDNGKSFKPAHSWTNFDGYTQ